MRIASWILYALYILFVLNCQGSRPKKPYKNEWLILGKMTDETYAGGKVVAMGMDGTKFSSDIGLDQKFGIELPGDSTWALYFISNPSLDQATISLLNYEDSPDIGLTHSLRLPEALINRKIFLGEVDTKANNAYPTVNPAATLDFDMDGVPDLFDQDDQNDGLNDYYQKQDLEHIEICHLTSEDSGDTRTIPIEQLYYHAEHGDSFKPCQYMQGGY